MATSKEQIISLTRDNFHLIFGGASPTSRLEQIKKLWHPSGSILFTDPLVSGTTHDEIEALVAKLQEESPGFVFTERSEVQILANAGDTSFARLKWGYGLPGEEFKVKGEDVLTIRDGRIERLYVYFD